MALTESVWFSHTPIYADTDTVAESGASGSPPRLRDSLGEPTSVHSCVLEREGGRKKEAV